MANDPIITPTPPGSGADAVLADGSVTPAKVSAVATDDFVFPRDVKVGRNIIGTALPMKIRPTVDDLLAIQFTNAAGAPIVTVDTVDGFIGINLTAPHRSLAIGGDASCNGSMFCSAFDCETFLSFRQTYAKADIIGGAATAGKITFASDTKKLMIADGTAWHEVTLTGLLPGVIAGTGTVTPDATVAGTFSTTVTGALTLNGPTGGYDGQKIMFRLLQDGTGHAVTFATGANNFRFGTDISSFTASALNLTDYVGAVWNSAASRWDIVSVVQGF